MSVTEFVSLMTMKVSIEATTPSKDEAVKRMGCAAIVAKPPFSRKWGASVNSAPTSKKAAAVGAKKYLMREVLSGHQVTQKPPRPIRGALSTLSLVSIQKESESSGVNHEQSEAIKGNQWALV